MGGVVAGAGGSGCAAGVQTAGLAVLLSQRGQGLGSRTWDWSQMPLRRHAAAAVGGGSGGEWQQRG